MLILEVAILDKKIKQNNTALTELIATTGSTLQELNGIGPALAARLLADIGYAIVMGGISIALTANAT